MRGGRRAVAHGVRADASDFEELAEVIWVEGVVELFAVDTACEEFFLVEEVESEAEEDALGWRWRGR